LELGSIFSIHIQKYNFQMPIAPYHVTDAISALHYLCLILLKLLSIINSRSPMASCDIWRSIAMRINYEKFCFNGSIIGIDIFYFYNLLRIFRSFFSSQYIEKSK
jgi:hypothetical protein